MTREELLDALTTLALECGRGDAYSIRKAAGVPTNTRPEDEIRMRAFIEHALA